MQFDLEKTVAVLSRTPATLTAMLKDLPDEWTHANEGPDTWSAYEVIGHLIHGEQTDWIPRLKIILEHGESRTFDPFDRPAQSRSTNGKPIEDLLDQFAMLRQRNLVVLDDVKLTAGDLERVGRHPELGRVTTKELLATWMAHDLSHVAQVARIMARQYATEVGPWHVYLSILRDRTQSPG